MCGRYTLKASPEALQEAFDIEQMPEGWRARWNLAPTQAAPIIANRNTTAGPRVIEAFRWGLVPSWAKDMRIASRLINARSETAASKPSFRVALQRRRCLVLADGYYEWRKAGREKIPTWIHRPDERPFAMAGLWERWQQHDGAVLFTFTILTTAANATIAPVHHRMPVILDPPSWQDWLDPAPVGPELLQSLLQPASAHEFSTRIVGQRVNSARHDDAECLAPPRGSLL